MSGPARARPIDVVAKACEVARVAAVVYLRGCAPAASCVPPPLHHARIGAGARIRDCQTLDAATLR